MKISVITPSIRNEMLSIVMLCLLRQTFQDFEWIVVGPESIRDYAIKLKSSNYSFYFVEEPPKREGDYYNLNKAWNLAFKKAKGELIVSIVDGLWFTPDVLEKLWIHYQNNPMACIGGVGGQYDKIENGKPEHLIWQDPRITGKGFHEISPMDMEWCIASIPLKALREVNFIDPEWDKYAALSEKATNMRMSKKDYKFFLDESCEYRAIKHDRISPEWDKKYQEGCKYFQSLTF